MNKDEILKKLENGEISADDASKLLSELEAPKRRGQLYCKVSPKGALSVYGLQRMPVTLYVEQWERLFGFVDEIRQFMTDHSSEFTRKGSSRSEE